MKVVRINNPKLCQRVGNSWTVRADPGIDLSNTVLHQLQHEDEIPSFKLSNNLYLTIRDIRSYSKSFLPHQLFNSEGESQGTYINLPDYLQVIDALLGDIIRNLTSHWTKQNRKERILTNIQRIIDGNIIHWRTTSPGIMTFVLGGNLKEGEVGISERMGRKFIISLLKDRGEKSNEIFHGLCSELSKKDRTTAQLVYMITQGHMKAKPEAFNEVLNKMVKQLDGLEVYGLRYPNASSTSHEKKILRIVRDQPFDLITMPVKDLVIRHQGDCDGDRAGTHIPRVVRRQEPNSIKWDMKYNKGHCNIDLLSLKAPEMKQPLDLMTGFLRRGRHVGMLTYNFWLLCYTIAINHQEFNLKNKQEAFPMALDLFTPLIEGNMNARKGTGSGETSDGRDLAELFCEMCGGNIPFEEVLSLLPTKKKGEIDEEKFTEDQVNLLRKIFTTLAGPNKNKVGLLNSDNGVKKNAVVYYSIGLRNNKDATRFLLSEVPKDKDFYKFVQDNSLGLEMLLTKASERKNLIPEEEEAWGEEYI